LVAESAVFELGFDAAETKMSEGRITARLSGETRVGITFVAVNEIVAVEKVVAVAVAVAVSVAVAGVAAAAGVADAAGAAAAAVVATAIVFYSFPPTKNWTDLESFLVEDAIASPS
jgi:hypothetical protein